MTKRNRRQFLEESMLAAAAAAAAVSGVDELLAEPLPSGSSVSGSSVPGRSVPGSSVNGQLGVAVVGVRGRGNSHLGFYASRPDTRVLYVCDVDSRVGTLRAQQSARRHGGVAPRVVEDLRHVLDDPRVDIVSIAAPNHWHALAAIWAMQAGKDVYVEKPVSHNVVEGRRMVEAARRHQRICQSGFQARSNPGMIAAIRFVQAGGIGTVRLARGLCYKRRRAVGATGIYPVPPHVNYDLWLGPAPAAPLTRQRFHYDWHWQWPYGNGELGNQGVHQLDICRWGLRRSTIGESVFSYGGRFGCPDTTQPTNTQVSVHGFGDQSIVMEIRGLRSRPLRGVHVGVIFEGSDGYVVMTSYHSGTAFDLEGRPLRHFRGGGGGELHFSNFLQAVEQRSCLRLHADIEEGHLSSALAHIGNISYRLGCDLPLAAAKSQLASFDVAGDMMATLERTEQHLLEHAVDLDATSFRFGKVLSCDPTAEVFRNDPTANRMLTRTYRPPYVLPAAPAV